MSPGALPTIGEALRFAARELEGVSCEEAAREARLLLSHILGLPAARLALDGNAKFPGQYCKALENALERRKGGEPLQYILGVWEFMGLPMRVDRRALIPRQDTETLAEEALRLAAERGYRSALDLCAGSGCVGIALKKLGGLETTLADISPEALSLAKENAKLNGVRVRALESDLFARVEGRYDMIVCNPPYLGTADMASLQREVTHEPALALYGGQDGLDFYRRIGKDYGQHLPDGGALLLEVGAGQAEAVRALFGGGRAVRDCNDIERVIVL